MAMNKEMLRQRHGLTAKIQHFKDELQVHKQLVTYYTGMIQSYKERLKRLDQDGKELGPQGCKHGIQ